MKRDSPSQIIQHNIIQIYICNIKKAMDNDSMNNGTEIKELLKLIDHRSA